MNSAPNGTVVRAGASVLAARDHLTAALRRPEREVLEAGFALADDPVGRLVRSKAANS